MIVTSNVEAHFHANHPLENAPLVKYLLLECNKGQPYNITLKLSGCSEDEFTCADGQCISINSRCDQIINCRDESDEQECKLLVLKNGYNKAIPPFTLVKISFCYIICSQFLFLKGWI